MYLISVVEAVLKGFFLCFEAVVQLLLLRPSNKVSSCIYTNIPIKVKITNKIAAMHGYTYNYDRLCQE